MQIGNVDYNCLCLRYVISEDLTTLHVTSEYVTSPYVTSEDVTSSNIGLIVGLSVGLVLLVIIVLIVVVVLVVYRRRNKSTFIDILSYNRDKGAGSVELQETQKTTVLPEPDIDQCNWTMMKLTT